MTQGGEVCVCRLQQSTKAINDFEDKPLSSASDPGLCIFFVVTPFFKTYFPPLVLYFKQFLRGYGCFCGVFSFPLVVTH